MRVICIGIILCLCNVLYAQDSVYLELKVYGDFEESRLDAIQEFANGDIIMAGQAYGKSADLTDIYLVRTDVSGDLIWSKKIGGDDHDYATDLIISENNNLFVVGKTRSYGDGEWGNVFVLKLNEYGDSIWLKTYGGLDFEDAKDIIQTSDGNFVITGTSKSMTNGGKDVFLFSIDLDGNLLWTRNFGSSKNEYGCASIEIPNLGFVITLNTEAPEVYNYKASVLCVNYQGDTLWNVNPSEAMASYFYDMILTDDNNFVCAGYSVDSIDNLPNKEAWCIKLNNNGDVLLSDSFGGWSSDMFYCLTQMNNNDFVFAGLICSLSNFLDYDLFVVRTDVDFNLKYLGVSDVGGWPRYAKGIIQTQNNNLAIAGVYRVGAAFYLINQNLLDAPILCDNSKLYVYPNPASNHIYVYIPDFSQKLNGQIYNNQGQLVQEFILNEKGSKIGVENLPCGAYNLQVVNGQHKYISKFIIHR